MSRRLPAAVAEALCPCTQRARASDRTNTAAPSHHVQSNAARSLSVYGCRRVTADKWRTS